MHLVTLHLLLEIEPFPLTMTAARDMLRQSSELLKYACFSAVPEWSMNFVLGMLKQIQVSQEMLAVFMFHTIRG